MKLTLEEKLRLVKLHIIDGVPIREIHEKTWFRSFDTKVLLCFISKMGR